jgi:hypothetical protein
MIVTKLLEYNNHLIKIKALIILKVKGSLKKKAN